jgi:hypothetical protein
VYYEVSKLFAKTEWDSEARQRLQYLMDKGLTKAKEVSPIENVFFGLDEDVNGKVDALLKASDKDVDLSAGASAEGPGKKEKQPTEEVGDGATDEQTGATARDSKKE